MGHQCLIWVLLTVCLLWPHISKGQNVSGIWQPAAGSSVIRGYPFTVKVNGSGLVSFLPLHATLLRSTNSSFSVRKDIYAVEVFEGGFGFEFSPPSGSVPSNGTDFFMNVTCDGCTPAVGAISAQFSVVELPPLNFSGFTEFWPAVNSTILCNDRFIYVTVFGTGIPDAQITNVSLRNVLRPSDVYFPQFRSSDGCEFSSQTCDFYMWPLPCSRSIPPAGGYYFEVTLDAFGQQWFDLPFTFSIVQLPPVVSSVTATCFWDVVTRTNCPVGVGALQVQIVAQYLADSTPSPDVFLGSSTNPSLKFPLHNCSLYCDGGSWCTLRDPCVIPASALVANSMLRTGYRVIVCFPNTTSCATSGDDLKLWFYNLSLFLSPAVSAVTMPRFDVIVNGTMEMDGSHVDILLLDASNSSSSALASASIDCGGTLPSGQCGGTITVFNTDTIPLSLYMDNFYVYATYTPSHPWPYTGLAVPDATLSSAVFRFVQPTVANILLPASGSLQFFGQTVQIVAAATGLAGSTEVSATFVRDSTGGTRFGWAQLNCNATSCSSNIAVDGTRLSGMQLPVEDDFFLEIEYPSYTVAGTTTFQSQRFTVDFYEAPRLLSLEFPTPEHDAIFFNTSTMLTVTGDRLNASHMPSAVFILSNMYELRVPASFECDASSTTCSASVVISDALFLDAGLPCHVEEIRVCADPGIPIYSVDCLSIFPNDRAGFDLTPYHPYVQLMYSVDNQVVVYDQPFVLSFKVHGARPGIDFLTVLLVDPDFVGVYGDPVATIPCVRETLCYGSVIIPSSMMTTVSPDRYELNVNVSGISVSRTGQFLHLSESFDCDVQFLQPYPLQSVICGPSQGAQQVKWLWSGTDDALGRVFVKNMSGVVVLHGDPIWLSDLQYTFNGSSFCDALSSGQMYVLSVEEFALGILDRTVAFSVAHTTAYSTVPTVLTVEANSGVAAQLPNGVTLSIPPNAVMQDDVMTPVDAYLRLSASPADAVLPSGYSLWLGQPLTSFVVYSNGSSGEPHAVKLSSGLTMSINLRKGIETRAACQIPEGATWIYSVPGSAVSVPFTLLSYPALYAGWSIDPVSCTASVAILQPIGTLFLGIGPNSDPGPSGQQGKSSSSDSSGPSETVIAGAVVGSIFGVALIMGAVTGALFWIRKRRTEQALTTHVAGMDNNLATSLLGNEESSVSNDPILDVRL